MPQEDELRAVAFFPNGEMNAPFILANAQLLLKEGEYIPALSLFRLLKDHKTLGHCAHYGIGQCFFAAKDWEQAIRAFGKSFSLAKRTYSAKALLDALMSSQQYTRVEECAVQFAKEFTDNPAFVDEVRRVYRDAIRLSS